MSRTGGYAWATASTTPGSSAEASRMRCREPLDFLALNARQVISHAHIEQGLGRGDFQTMSQGVDQNPRVKVLPIGSLEGQLLRPFAVERHVLGIDARPRDLDAVEQLHGLELNESGAAQPGRDDVLRQLRVRSGSDSKGKTDRLPQKCRGRAWVELREVRFRYPKHLWRVVQV